MPWQPSTPRPVLPRAEAALLEDPSRSDGLIALAVSCAAPTIGRASRGLEQRVMIEQVPVPDRVPRPYPVQPSRTRAAIEAGACTPREVADAAGVSIQMAWKALKRTRRPVADAAGAADSISIRKSSPKWNIRPPTEDYRAPLASLDPRTRAPRLAYDPDPDLEEFCITCTAVWGSQGWEHERSCPFRRSRPRR